MTTNNKQSIESPLAKARGTGSAKSGAHHWWMMKVTSLLLIPLTLWFFVAILCLMARGAGYDTVMEWLKTPHVTGLMIVFLAVNFYHAAEGGAEIILDYVHCNCMKIPALLVYKSACYAAGFVGIMAVLTIAFGG